MSSFINNLLLMLVVVTDKFSAVVDIQGDEIQAQIICNIKNLVVSLVKKFSHLDTHMYGKGNYRYAIKLPLGDNFDGEEGQSHIPFLIVQAAPKGNKAFLRYELKGFPLKWKHYYRARLWLEQIVPGNAHAQLLSNNQKITSFDIAHDINVHINNLSANLTRTALSGVWFDTNGSIGTMYMGGKKSKFRVVIYNRVENCRAKQKPCGDDVLTRIEVQFKPDCLLSDLNNLLASASYLNRIEIYDMEALRQHYDIHPDTLRLINVIGLKATLQGKSDSDRKKLRKACKKAHVDFLPNEKVKIVLAKELSKLKALHFNLFGKKSKSRKATKARQRFKKLYL